MTILLRQKPLPQVVRQIVQRYNGAWFDPEDLSTMFQDAAGTTPVTALEQPVGLWLDKSQGLELGPELVVNGGFDSTAAWITAYGTTISGGKLTTSNAVDASQQTIYGVVLGNTYKITFTIDSISSGKARCIFTGSVSPYFTQAGTYTIYQQATTNNSLLYLGFGGVATTCVIDNISVRELKGNHATQSITASRPTLSARYNQLLNSATLSTQSVTTVAAQYTLSFTGTGSVTLSGTATGTLTGTGADNRVSLSFTPTAGTLTLTVTGSVTLAMLSFGTPTTYQAITNATNYDSVGFPKYIKAEGVDDHFVLPYLGLYNNASCSIIASHSSSSQAANGVIVSEASSTDADTKYLPYRQLASAGNVDSYIAADNAAVILDSTGAAYSGTKENIIESIIDSGTSIETYRSGVLLSNEPYTRSATLTLNNTTLFGSVSTTNTNFLNTKLYGLIITKSNLSARDRSLCETYLKSKVQVLQV